MKPKYAKRPPPTSAALVPGVEEMDDEVMYKHLNARHKTDLGIKDDMHYSPLYAESLVEAHRAFHRRQHELATPGRYDHEHVGDN
jgi:hypothetical protein